MIVVSGDNVDLSLNNEVVETRKEDQREIIDAVKAKLAEDPNGTQTERRSGVCVGEVEDLMYFAQKARNLEQKVKELEEKNLRLKRVMNDAYGRLGEAQ